MGRGDIRSKKGKISRGTSGNSRPSNKKVNRLKKAKSKAK